MFAKVGKEELEINSSGSGSDVQVGVVAEVSTSVFCPVYVEQFTRFGELFNGESKPFRIREVHEIFGGS